MKLRHQNVGSDTMQFRINHGLQQFLREDVKELFEQMLDQCDMEGSSIQDDSFDTIIVQQSEAIDLKQMFNDEVELVCLEDVVVVTLRS